MKFVDLVLHPHKFFAQPTDSVGWAWPIAGFYLFAFATYFQGHLVPGYHIPFYVVVYIMAWFPTFMVGAALFVLLILFWYWPASMALGKGQGLEQSTKIVGIALLPPAIFFWIVLVVLTVFNSNDLAVPYRAIVATAHSAAGLWALALVVVGATVVNKLTAAKAALFASWLVILLVLGILVYSISVGS